ncbi:MAG: rod shape-determining protein MreD [Eubacteriales bacterium]|nr:rod shape-determining protein MreD [Eubacteriales bacterium]
MKRKIVEFLLILLFYLIQITFGNAISIGNIAPNLLIILPVLFGFFNGKNEGMYLGFVSGMFYDLFSSSLFGFSALIFVYVGYLSGMFYKEYEKVEILIPLAIVIISDFAYEFMMCIGMFLLHGRLNMGYFISRFIMPEVVYTAIVTLVIYYPSMYLDLWLNKEWGKKRKGMLDEGSI